MHKSTAVPKWKLHSVRLATNLHSASTLRMHDIWQLFHTVYASSRREHFHDRHMATTTLKKQFTINLCLTMHTQISWLSLCHQYFWHLGLAFIVSRQTSKVKVRYSLRRSEHSLADRTRKLLSSEVWRRVLWWTDLNWNDSIFLSTTQRYIPAISSILINHTPPFYFYCKCTP